MSKQPEEQQSCDKQEPVAWLDEYGNSFPLAAKQYSVVGKHWKPLYTSPPQHVLMAEYWKNQYEELKAQLKEKNT